jgi:DNA processing protein
MRLTHLEQIMLLQKLPLTGVAAYWKLLEHYANLASALDAPASELRKVLKDEAVDYLLDVLNAGEEHSAIIELRQHCSWLKAHDIHLVDIDSDFYPILLREIKRAPPLLYVWGNQKALSCPQIAIVGSRSPSAGGRSNAQKFASDLVQAGFVITSGLALGIDVAAHHGALEGEGETLAILGTGIDQIYPSRHRGIAERIVANGGALVTEFPVGIGALPSNFPQRNRIISGLSCGVLVVEAAIKSGSLITARYAIQQNRDVFAIPGSIQNPLSRGCHALIKDGAKLVESAEDIIEELHSMLAFNKNEINTGKLQEQISRELVGTESIHEVLVMDRLGFDPVSFDTIAERTDLPAGELMACLLTMELKGLVANLGHRYARVKS